MSHTVEIPLTSVLGDMIVPAGMVALAAAGLAAATGAEALRGWRDLLAALAASTAPAGAGALSAEAQADAVPLRMIGTPIRDEALLDRAIAAEGLRAVAPPDAADPTRVILDQAGRQALLLQLGAQGGTAVLIDAAGVVAVRDDAVRHDLITRLCGDPEQVLDRLTRRYAALAVADALKKAGMTVTEEANGTVRATTQDRATGGTRTVTFDAFSAAPARAHTRHRRPGGGAAPCSGADEAVVHDALRRPDRPGGTPLLPAAGRVAGAPQRAAEQQAVSWRQPT